MLLEWASTSRSTLNQSTVKGTIILLDKGISLTSPFAHRQVTLLIRVTLNDSDTSIARLCNLTASLRSHFKVLHYVFLGEGLGFIIGDRAAICKIRFVSDQDYDVYI
jgi:hypothetical protein